MQVISFIVELITIIIVCYVAFFKSYIQEKGKNLATKEDIGEVTKIIETVKKGLNDETELLKSQLSLHVQNRFSIKNAEREALFDLSKTYSAWLYTLMNFSFSGYDENNLDDLQKALNNFSEKQYQFDLAKSHLKLFMQDEDFLEMISELTISTIELEKVVTSAIIPFKYQHIIYNLKKKYDTATEPKKLYEEMFDQVKPILAKHSEGLISNFKRVTVKHAMVADEIMKRILAIKED